MKSLWAFVGWVIVAGTGLMHGQDLGFQVQAGSDTDTVTLSPGNNGTWTYSTGTFTLNNSTITTAPIGNTGTSGLVIDPDPSINFGFGVTNNGTTTQQYTFTFPMPTMALAVNLPPGSYNISSTFGDTLTASPGDTASFSLPGGATTYMQSFINGVDVLDIASGANNPETVTGGATGNTQTFSFPTSTSPYVLTTTGTTMSVTTTFDLTPGDSASFSGSFTVITAPEPPTSKLVLIAGLGLVVLATRARYQRS